MALDVARPSLSRHRKCWILVVSGELDFGTAPGLDDHLDPVIGSGSRTELLLDLEGVTFIDCAGIRPLVRAHDTMGDRLYLRDLRPAVTRVLDLVGLATTFEILQPGAPWPDRPWPVEVETRSHELRIG